MENDDFRAEAYLKKTFDSLFKEDEEKGKKVQEPPPKRSEQTRKEKKVGWMKGINDLIKHKNETSGKNESNPHSSLKTPTVSNIKDSKMKK